MIFTIGKTEWYNQWSKEQGENFKKRGKDEYYTGGSAFLCFGKAIASCPKGYSVYRLDTDIENLYQLGGDYYIKQGCRIYKL